MVLGKNVDGPEANRLVKLDLQRMFIVCITKDMDLAGPSDSARIIIVSNLPNLL
jgi:hypothetical protein